MHLQFHQNKQNNASKTEPVKKRTFWSNLNIDHTSINPKILKKSGSVGNLYIKCVYELQDIGGDLHDSTLQMCNASKANSSLCTSSGGVFLYLAIKFLNISSYTSYVYPR